MKKFYIEFPIFDTIKSGFLRYVTELKKAFTPDFIKQNYHKHLGYSLVLTMVGLFVLDKYFNAADTGIFLHLFLGAFGAYCVNWVREAYYNYKSKEEIPFDQSDVNFGSYGGILAAVIYLLLKSL